MNSTTELTDEEKEFNLAIALSIQSHQIEIHQREAASKKRRNSSIGQTNSKPQQLEQQQPIKIQKSNSNSNVTNKIINNKNDNNNQKQFKFGSGEYIWHNRLSNEVPNRNNVSLNHLIDIEQCNRALFTTMTYDDEFLRAAVPTSTTPVLIVKHPDLPTEPRGLYRHARKANIKLYHPRTKSLQHVKLCLVKKLKIALFFFRIN